MDMAAIFEIWSFMVHRALLCEKILIKDDKLLYIIFNYFGILNFLEFILKLLKALLRDITWWSPSHENTIVLIF